MNHRNVAIVTGIWSHTDSCVISIQVISVPCPAPGHSSTPSPTSTPTCLGNNVEKGKGCSIFKKYLNIKTLTELAGGAFGYKTS